MKKLLSTEIANCLTILNEEEEETHSGLEKRLGQKFSPWEKSGRNVSSSVSFLTLNNGTWS